MGSLGVDKGPDLAVPKSLCLFKGYLCIRPWLFQLKILLLNNTWRTTGRTYKTRNWGKGLDFNIPEGLGMYFLQNKIGGSSCLPIMTGRVSIKDTVEALWNVGWRKQFSTEPHQHHRMRDSLSVSTKHTETSSSWGSGYILIWTQTPGKQGHIWVWLSVPARGKGWPDIIQIYSRRFPHELSLWFKCCDWWKEMLWT